MVLFSLNGMFMSLLVNQTLQKSQPPMKSGNLSEAQVIFQNTLAKISKKNQISLGYKTIWLEVSFEVPSNT